MGTYLERHRHLGRGTWLLFANTLGAYAGYGVVLLVYNLYLVALGYHEDLIGLVASVNAVAMIGGSVGAVAISQRWGHGWCLATGTAGVVISGLGLSLAAEPVSILGLSALNGFTLGQLFVPTGPFLIEHSRPEDRQDAFALIFAAQSASQALGSAIAGVLPTIFAAALALGSPVGVVPLRLTLLAGALLSGLGLVPGVWLVRLPPATGSSAPRPTEIEPRRSGRSDRRLILIFASVIVLTSISTGFIAPFLNVYLADRLGATTEVVGLIFVMISGVGVIAQLAGPAIARRLGVVTAIWIVRLLTIPIVLGMAFIPNLTYAGLAVIARGGLVAMTWPLDNAFGLGLVSARNAARLASTRSVAFNIGQAVSSPIAGQIIVAAGYPPTFAISACGMLIAGLVHYRAFRREDPHPGLRRRFPAAGVEM